MNKLIPILLLIAVKTHANTIYISPDGNDKNPGTITQPLATIQKAQSHLHPGDTAFIRGGLYRLTENDITRTERIYACITFLDKSGKPGKYIHYLAYPGETPVFNYEAIKPKDLRVAAFYVTGSYIHLKGFEVTGVQVTIKTHTQSECFENHGSFNIYEQLSMHDGMAIGFYLLEGSFNLIVNCDAYRNFDNFSENGRGGNTDGFGCHTAAGSKGNTFVGCRAWFNSDDGFDLINSHESTTFSHCWAFYNGYTPDFQSEGDGNGFKCGGYGSRPADQIPNPVPQNNIEHCLAVRNKASGFYSNHHINGSQWSNNSAYNNHIDFNMLNRLPDNRTDVPGYKHQLEDNLAYKGAQILANIDTAACKLINNSFQQPSPPTDEDFLSLDESQLTAHRLPDGNLPFINFLRPKPGSPFAEMGIFSDDFKKQNPWFAENEDTSAMIPPIHTNGDTLIINSRRGLTVWYLQKLTGNIRIEYDRTILVGEGAAAGPNDRLSDCNQFWMATDPKNENLFTRHGKLEEYDNLDLYYVGMGGNTNKTTRFRTYAGGARTLIKEYLDTAHLLQKNREYHITITVINGTSTFNVDGQPWFTYTDPRPLTTGYFGFRSTWSRQAIRNFKITQLP